MKRKSTNIVIIAILGLTVLVAGCDKLVIAPGETDLLVKAYNFKVEAVAETPDGGFLLNCENRIVKLDADGIELWQKPHVTLFGAIHPEEIRIFPMADGNLLFVGTTLEELLKPDAWRGWLHLFKTDASGNQIDWDDELPVQSHHVSKYLEPQQSLILANVVQDRVDDNFIFAMTLIEDDVSGEGPRMDQLLFVEVNARGDRVAEGIHDFEDGHISKMIQTADDGYLLTGIKSQKAYAAKFDNNFAKSWENEYDIGSGAQLANNVLEATGESAVYITGWINNGNIALPDYDYFILKTGLDGTETDHRFYDANELKHNDFCFSSILTQDGTGIVLIGGTRVLTTYEKETNLFAVKAETASLDTVFTQKYGTFYGMEGVFVKENTNGNFTMIGYKFAYENTSLNQSFLQITKEDGSMF